MSAVVGKNPWMSPLQLWRLKLGIDSPQDLSGNAAVEAGVRYEPILRDYYIATHPEYTLEYYPFDILYQAEKPYLTATLDGELTDSQGRKGILEIKNVSISNRAMLDKWMNGKMPEYYYVQLIAQLNATQYQFARLFSALHFMNGDTTLKEFEVEREEVLDDMAWLDKKGTAFWTQNILGGKMPSAILTL